MLNTIPRFGIMRGEREESRDTFLAARVGQWETWIASGHVGFPPLSKTTRPRSPSTVSTGISMLGTGSTPKWLATSAAVLATACSLDIQPSSFDLEKGIL